MRRVGVCAVALSQLRHAHVSRQPSMPASSRLVMLPTSTAAQPGHALVSSLWCSRRARSTRASRKATAAAGGGGEAHAARRSSSSSSSSDKTTWTAAATSASSGSVSAAAAAASAAARTLWMSSSTSDTCGDGGSGSGEGVVAASPSPSPPLPVQPDVGTITTTRSDDNSRTRRVRTPRRSRVETTPRTSRNSSSKARASATAADAADDDKAQTVTSSAADAVAADVLVQPPTPHTLDLVTAMTLPTAAALAEHAAAATATAAVSRKRRPRATVAAKDETHADEATTSAKSAAADADEDEDDESDEHAFFADVLQHASAADKASTRGAAAATASLALSAPSSATAAAPSSSSLSPRTFDDTTLVYNALTGRMTSETSPTMRQLIEMGFGVNAQRHLCVRDAAALNAYAARVRSGDATLSPKWPVTLTRTLASVFANARLPDAAQAIQYLMQVKINSVTRSRYASVVVAAPDGSSSAGSAAAANEDGTAAATSTHGASQQQQQQQQSSDSNSVASLIDDDANDPTRGVELNAEQERVIDIALRGHHMYIGGSAGTGKTVLLRVLSRRLQAHRLRVAMTATTGVAGCHVGGCTFHHAFGVSARGEFLRRGTLLDYDVIIIDEVSMLPQRLFEDLDRVLRAEAGTPEVPFGGVQIILCGDFLQLGCVYEASLIHSRLFHSHFVALRLQTQVRQSAHPKFADDLQRMRLGDVPADLTTTVRQLPPGTMVQSAVNLLPTNKEVHVANAKELERLPGEALTLSPETGITALKCETTATLLLRTTPRFVASEFAQHVRALLQATLDLPRASLLSLYKIYEDGHAMRVMLPPGESVAWREAMRERFLEIAGLLNDLDLGATVTEIVPSGDGLHTPECEEYLQRLMTKHPVAQPLTMKKGCRVLLRANLSSNLVNGSIGTVVDYAPCKPESFAGYLRNSNVDACIERYRVFCETECGMPAALVPVVRFHSGETVAVPPWEFAVGGMANTHYYSLSSVALPLSLAYAFTVHKVQGLTLVGRVHLELSRMWPCDHLLYVAMSRVRNPEQLSMSSFTPAMVVANADCVRFDRQLLDVNAVTEATLSRFVVAAWKRCNDTLYHLRRRGTSLRKLLEQVTHNSLHSSGSGNGSGSGSGSQRVYSDAEGAYAMTMSRQQLEQNDGEGSEYGGSSSSGNSGSDDAPCVVSAQHAHLLAIEHSVLVARRMRKLVKHVERVAKLTELRRRARTTTTTTAATAAATTNATDTTSRAAYNDEDDNAQASALSDSAHAGDMATSAGTQATVMHGSMRYIEEHAI